MTTQAIYSGRCVRCGAVRHRGATPFFDGEIVEHIVLAHDHNGVLHGLAACGGAFAPLMGRAARAGLISRHTELFKAREVVALALAQAGIDSSVEIDGATFALVVRVGEVG